MDNTKTVKLKPHIKKILDYLIDELQENCNYAEKHDLWDIDKYSLEQLEKIDKSHIYYSIKYILTNL